jgi:hypothetical protein
MKSHFHISTAHTSALRSSTKGCGRVLNFAPLTHPQNGGLQTTPLAQEKGYKNIRESGMCAVMSESHQLVFFLGDEAKSKEERKLVRKLGKYNRPSLPPLYDVVTIWSLLFTDLR